MLRKKALKKPRKTPHQTAATNKPWYQSKTLWLNALAAALVVVEANFSLLQAELGNQAYIASMGALAAANLVLRSITREGLNFRSQP